jgi:hypothetical protein
MLDVFGFPTPEGANYQEFYNQNTRGVDWVKPRGVSMVRILLIGAGAAGRTGDTTAGGAGGGSGAVTQWIGPAIFIPDILRITLGVGGGSGNAGTDTTVVYQVKNGTGYTLLTAQGAPSNTGASAETNNFFGASGIFTSIAGQNGAAQATAITASTTTFLSGGAGGASTVSGTGASVATNYGYPSVAGGTSAANGVAGGNGYFLTQPVLLSVGGAGGGGGTANAGGSGGRGGIGSGGGGGGRGGTLISTGGRGGNGAAFIWSW